MAMKVITMPGDKPGKDVEYLIKLAEGKALLFNDEYQRAPAWKEPQKQLFIDSIFRGYSIPAFYFHKTGSVVEDLGGQYYEVIDGQQRIRAIREFKNNEFPLLPQALFLKLPPFLRERDTTWDGRFYNELPPEMQNRFLHQPIVIYEMTTDNSDEIRDLFIRLQGGTPLSAQDKRDTYPGELPKFVMEMGGKPPLNKDDIKLFSGHVFFNNMVRGGMQNNRKLAAQLLLLVSHNVHGREISFCDINSRALDNFYLNSVGAFSPNCIVASRFKKSIDNICGIFRSNTLPLAGHEAIHLVLLVNSLSDGYVSGWDKKLPEAFSQFRENCKKAKKEKEKNGDYYMRYVRWVSQSSDRASTIEERHDFFMGEMLRMLSPMTKDPKRSFSTAEKERIYLRDRGFCQWCQMRGKKNGVRWDESVFHHIIPHAEGGRTEPENGALMHAKCHPLTPDAVVKFREWWDSEGKHIRQPVIEKGKKRKIADLPEGTKCRFEHEEEIYEGKIVGGKLVMDIGEFPSFKKPSEIITRDTRPQNWWESWDIQEPGNEHWIPAINWQPGGR